MSTDSNQVTPQESHEVVDWEEEMMRQAKAVAAIERPKVSQISTRAGVLSYQQVPIPGNKLNCIVVSSIYERNYFATKFDPGNIQAPACYAFSETGEDMVPDESIEKPISPECGPCPYNEWGSDTDSQTKRGKRCKELRKLALIAYNAEGKYEGAELAILRIPVTSIGNWSMYVNQVAGAAKRPFYAVVTEISLAPNVKTQFQINFKFVERIEREHFATFGKLRELGTKVLMTPYEQSQQKEVTDSKKF